MALGLLVTAALSVISFGGFVACTWSYWTPPLRTEPVELKLGQCFAGACILSSIGFFVCLVSTLGELLNLPMHYGVTAGLVLGWVVVAAASNPLGAFEESIRVAALRSRPDLTTRQKQHPQ